MRYDIRTFPVGMNSATGYIMKNLGHGHYEDISNGDIRLEICGISEVSNLEMLKSFFEDLIYLRDAFKVEVVFVNKW